MGRPKIFVWSPVLYSSLMILFILKVVSSFFCWLSGRRGQRLRGEGNGDSRHKLPVKWSILISFKNITINSTTFTTPPLSPSPSDYGITTTIMSPPLPTTIKATITTINVKTTNTTINIIIIIIIISSVMMNIAGKKQLQWCKNMICSSELFSFEKYHLDVSLNFPFSANQKPAKTFQDPHWLRRAWRRKIFYSLICDPCTAIWTVL